VPLNYVLINRQTLTTGAASFTFNNIPQTGYTDLKIVVSARSTYAGGYVAMRMNPNGSTSNATSRIVYGSGTGTASFSDTIIYSNINANNSATNTFGNCEIYCPNYTSTTKPKSFNIDAVTEENGAVALGLMISALWANNTSISSLYFAPTVGDFMVGSSFALYGIAAVGTTPTVFPKASGGDIVVNDGTYWYHAFLSSGAFIPSANLTCDYLVVAGGGGGARYTPGGGGAGGLRSTVTATGGGGALESPLSLLSGISIPVTVGAGGAGAITNTTPGIKGNTSGFSTVTTDGGGFAFNESGQAGSGGSGGGGSRSNNTPGSGTANQGYAGGTGTSAPNFGGGGGGGAGAVGGNGTTSVGGNGGAGVAISALATPTGTGVSGFYAGGGGGAAYASAGSTGGSGGGGNGTVSPTAPGSGVANTGGGGGSVAADGGAVVTQNGGNGGSGIVIVRYTMA
jgi:hypothetical protein